MTRRTFFSATGAALGAAALRVRAAPAPAQNPAWAGEVGLTTSSIFRQMAPGKADRYFSLADLPKILRDELGMRVLDLNSGTLGARDDAHCDRFRAALDAAGVAVSNVKVNTTVLGVKVQDLSIESPDRATRTAALALYREWIIAAQRVGARWLRPFPAEARPDLAILKASLAELAEFAAPRGITLVLENAGWMSAEADAIPTVAALLPGRLAAQPDTGAWENAALREAGLPKAFPHAVSCDFKFGRLGPAGEHAAYDLKRCFEIGWRSGFRGPWMLEHADDNTANLFRDLRRVRDLLNGWMRDAARG